MTKQKFQLGNRVIRSKGDCVVGRIGEIINMQFNGTCYRCQVKWDKAPKSWVVETSLELEAIPYKIIPMTFHEKDTDTKRKGMRKDWPKYQRL